MAALRLLPALALLALLVMGAKGLTMMDRPLGTLPGVVDCPPPDAAAARRSRLTTALRGGFGLQYFGEGYDAAGLAAAPHGLLIIEATRVGAQDSADAAEELFSPEEIDAVRRGGKRPVLAYLNVAEIETYRDYWASGDPAALADAPWVGADAEDGEHLAAFWTPEWRDILLQRVDRLMALGIDGIFLDDVLHYYTHLARPWQPRTSSRVAAAKGDRSEPAPLSDPAGEMMTLVKALAARARTARCDAIVVANNGAYIGRDAARDEAAGERFASYVDTLDGVVIENAFAPGAPSEVVDTLREDYLMHGARVMSIDFLPPANGAGSEDVAASTRAMAVGFAPYLAPDAAFDRLGPPIPLPGPPSGR